MQDDLDKEIEALENEIFGTPGEESTEEDLDTNSLDTEVKEVIKEEIKPKEGPTEAEVKRFNNYKASTDITIRDLRSDLAASKGKYANLQKGYNDLMQRLAVVETTSSKKIFSEEEIDILGEPAANALDKGVRDILDSKMKPLQEELARTRQESADRELRDAQQMIKKDYDVFLTKLSNVVPDYADLNVSNGFLKYMKEVDDYSGMPREYLFRKAEESLDVGRIASFFNDYKKKNISNTEILENAVTPTGKSGGASVSGDGKDQIITYQFIDKYYDDFNRGKYKSKSGREQAAKIEAMIDKAVISGKVQ